MSDKKVIVIGAGAAGISAATRLYENDIKDVMVLEAEDRIGGRIRTLDITGGNIIDLGAQWIHGEVDNAVFQLVKDTDLYNVSEVTFENMFFVHSSLGVLDQEVSERYLTLFNEIREEIDEENLPEFASSGHYFLHKLNDSFKTMPDEKLPPHSRDQFVEWFHQFINSIDASDSWFDSSSSTLCEYKECGGNHLVSWRNDGYSTILRVLLNKTEKLSNGSFSKNNIIRNTEVKKILLEKDKVQVLCDEKVYTADHVIVTVSLGVLKEKHEHLFETATLGEEKIRTIEGLSIGTVNKMFLKFPYQWWPKSINGYNFLWSNEDKADYKRQGLEWLTDVFSFCAVENAPLILCGWVCGPAARTMEQIAENEVKTRLMELLRKFIGNQCKIPEPESFWRSTWYTNEHFRGSYSYRSTLTDKYGVQSSTLSVPVKDKNNTPVILFAGEATHPHYYSTVHGAIETGWREADRIISLYKNAFGFGKYTQAQKFWKFWNNRFLRK